MIHHTGNAPVLFTATCQTTLTITEHSTGHKAGSRGTSLVFASLVLHILNKFGLAT